MQISDALERPLHDLRISLLDRCNFRCPYCMPESEFHDDYQFLTKSQRLTHEEILKIALRTCPDAVRVLGGIHATFMYKQVLAEAIAEGGTTLRDFVREDGQPGYFRIKLRVYEREGGECVRCGGTVRRRVIGQRASYFCPACQR